ncbi:MAG TPA: DUF4345 domain-containing protein [Myxococcota bacterium]|nr:DUF4345 domain-containing protein [Myxococcota bacterium]
MGDLSETRDVELGAFRAVVVALLLIPAVAGLTGAFGGIEGMARLFGSDAPLVLSPVLRNNFRAICAAFFSWAPLVAWSLATWSRPAGALRIILACGFLAGCARLTGWLVEGHPGAVAVAILSIELGGMPLLLVWHGRLLRRARAEE